jgi:hypothetical protein
MDYTDALNTFAEHYPAYRAPWLRRFTVEKCRVCGRPWPCSGFRTSGRIHRLTGERPLQIRAVPPHQSRPSPR